MTTINDINDLIRIIREDPDWAEALRSVLLSKELLALPDTFAAFVSETRENSRMMHQRLQNLEAGIAGIAATQASMGGDLSRLNGGDYENQAARRAPLLAANLLDVASIRTLSSTGNTRWLDDVALTAQLAGTITHAEALHLQAADLVMGAATAPARTTPAERTEETEAGPRIPNPARYLLAEISMTVQQRDLTRAVERAAILQKVTGVRTRPLVIGTAVEEGLDRGNTLFLEVPNLD